MSKFHDRRTGKIVDLPSVSESDQHEEFGSLYGSDDWAEPTCRGCSMPEPECEALEECNWGTRRKMDRQADLWQTFMTNEMVKLKT